MFTSTEWEQGIRKGETRNCCFNYNSSFDSLMYKTTFKYHCRDFPRSPVVKALSSQCKGAWVHSLVRELRQAQPKKKKIIITYINNLLAFPTSRYVKLDSLAWPLSLSTTSLHPPYLSFLCIFSHLVFWFPSSIVHLAFLNLFKDITYPAWDGLFPVWSKDLTAAAAAKSLQSCPTLCDPIDWPMQPTRLPRPWDSPGKNTGVGCHFLLQCMKVKSESEVSQSCPTLSDQNLTSGWKKEALEWRSSLGQHEEAPKCDRWDQSTVDREVDKLGRVC